jgi:hypothetical protein
MEESSAARRQNVSRNKKFAKEELCNLGSAQRRHPDRRNLSCSGAL